MNEKSESNSWPTRRKLLKWGAAAGAVTLSGCSGSNENEPTVAVGQTNTQTESNKNEDVAQNSTRNTGETSNNQGDPVDPTVNTLMNAQINPNEWNANQFSPRSARGTQHLKNIWTDPLIERTKSENNELSYIALSDFQVNDSGCVLTYKFRDNLKWWDGKQVTARDYKTQRLLYDYLTVSSQDQVQNEYEITDEQTLKVRRPSPIAPDLALPVQGNDYINIKHDYWKKWLQRYQDATTESEWQSISADLQQTSFGIETLVDEGLYNGLWKPVDWTPTSMTMEIFEPHFRSDWTNLKQWKNEWVPDSTKRREMVKNNQTDIWGDPSPGNDLEQFVDVPLNTARCMYFSAGDKHFARRPVRQAIAFLADQNTIARLINENFAASKKVAKYNATGMTYANASNWLGENWMSDNLIKYGPEPKLDKAAERMRAGGYTKDGDVWVDEDGDTTAGIKWLCPANPSIKMYTNYLRSKLEEFGIKTEVTYTTWAQFASNKQNIRQGNSENEWGAFDGNVGSVPEQQSIYSTTMGEYMSTADPKVVAPPPETEGSCQQRDIGTPELFMENGPLYGFRIRDEYPTAPKSLDPQDQMKTLYPVQWYRQSRQLQDQQQIRDIARQFVKYLNYNVLHLEFYHEQFTLSMDTKHFEISKPNHPESVLDDVYLYLRGMLTGKTQQEVQNN